MSIPEEMPMPPAFIFVPPPSPGLRVVSETKKHFLTQACWLEVGVEWESNEGGGRAGREVREKCPNQAKIKRTALDFAFMQTKCHFPIHIKVSVSNSSPFMHVLVEGECSETTEEEKNQSMD